MVLEFLNKEEKKLKHLYIRLFIANVIFFIILLILFKSVYATANLINGEIGFRNYLKQQQTKQYLNITLNISTNTTATTQTEQLKFPTYPKVLIYIAVFFILNNLYYLVLFYMRISTSKTLQDIT